VKMDREILFRGKRLNNGEWVCGNLIQMDSEGSQSFIFPFYKYASSLTCGQIVSMFMVAGRPRHGRTVYGADRQEWCEDI